MSTTWYGAPYVYTGGRFVENTWISVSDGVIVSVGEPPPAGGSQVGLHDAAIIPASVNTHTHSFQSLLRGTFDGLRLPKWLQGVYSASSDYSPEECYVGAAVTFADLVRNGTTAVADFFYLNARGNDNARAVVRAARDVGVRLVFGRAGLDAEWAGPGAREDVATAVSRLKELADEFADHPYVEISPSPHSIYGASRPMFEALAQLAVELDTRWYVHLTDPKSGVDNGLNRPGERTIPTLDEWGILSGRTVVVHALGLQSCELDLMAERGTGISWNPASGMWFGDGMLDLRAALRAGVRVGLGTDGAASNNALSILRESHIGSLGLKLAADDAAAVTAGDMFALATAGGAELLHLNMGALEPGAQADFVVLNALDLSLVPNSRLESHIVNSVSERAIMHVYRAGEQVVRDGQVVGVDEREIAKRASKLASRKCAQASLPLPGGARQGV